MKRNLSIFALVTFLAALGFYRSDFVRAQPENPDLLQRSGNLKLVARTENALSVTSAVFSPDQKFIVTGAAADGSLSVWDNIQGREIQRVKEHSDRITSISFAPDAEAFVTSSG
jgi:WD40 repeat protein